MWNTWVAYAVSIYEIDFSTNGLREVLVPSFGTVFLKLITLATCRRRVYNLYSSAITNILFVISLIYPFRIRNKSMLFFDKNKLNFEKNSALFALMEIKFCYNMPSAR